MNPKLIGCMIQPIRRLSLTMMCDLKKKKVGIGAELKKS